MTPTEELRSRLRKIIDESVPVGGTDGDTRFSDADINELLSDAENVYLAASEGWTLKAGKMQSELGVLTETQAGDERHKRVDLSTVRNYCIGMARIYAEKGKELLGGGSRLMGFEFPAPKVGDPR